MRTVSFVEHLEFEINGNVFSKAVALGDVDNDKGCELAIGNVSGELLVYKGSESKPWRKASDLGMITCVEIGDVFNQGINYLVTCSVEGWCNVFAVKPDSAVQDADGDEKIMKPVHKQHLAANSKVLLLADINGDGKKELVIGYSDRRVRSYRWQESSAEMSSNSTSPAGATSVSGSGGGGLATGKFVHVESWRLEGQLSSMTVHKHTDGSLELMVSQPGGTFVTLLGANQQFQQRIPGSSDKPKSRETSPKKTEDKGSLFTGSSLIYHPLGTARARNPGVSTEVLGNISRRKKGEECNVPNYYAICTLDGTLTLIDSDKILWSLYVDHQLFALSKLDVTGDGAEEVIACSWDGQTYIANLNRDVARYQFPENVAAFFAGYYSVSGTENVPCLIYVTFSNKILIYYNITLGEIGCSNLIETMKEKEGVHDLLNYFNVDASRPSEVRQLYHWCLYGLQPKNNST